MPNTPPEFVESGQKLICAGQKAASLIRLRPDARHFLMASALISRQMIPKRSTTNDNDMFGDHVLGIFHRV
jgi:hypothetical protein